MSRATTWATDNIPDAPTNPPDRDRGWHDVECKECGGEGEIECPWCNGGGDILNTDERPPVMEKCYECGGSGNLRCDGCRGTGSVEEYDPYADAWEEW